MSSSTTMVGDERRLRRRETPPRRRPAAPRGNATVRPDGPPASYYIIASIVVVLTLLGLVMVLSASSITSFQAGRSPWRFFSKQALWAAVGSLALVITMRVPYDRWRRWVLPILVTAFVMMTMPFVPGLGVSVNGARAWVQLGPIGFQPSEFLKIAVLLYCADLLTKRAHAMHVVKETLWPCLIVLGVSGAFLMAQGDLGSAIVLSSIVLAMAFIAGTPLTPLAGVSGVMALVTLGFVLSTEYRRDRWTAFLDVVKHRDDKGYQVLQSLIGIADGGLTGVGIGASRAKWGYLPLAHSDFIFAIVAEELGLVGVVAVLGSFLLLAFFGIQVALAAADRFGMLIAGGVTAWLCVQAIINVGGVTATMPLTGLTLPFVSFGGSSLLATMIGAGLLLNVARTSR